MKSTIRFALISITFLLHNVVFAPTSVPFQTSSFSSDHQILHTQHKKNQSEFRSLLNQAVQRNRGNSKGLREFFNVRDGYGMTILTRAASLVDMEQINFIMDQIVNFYGENSNNALDIFMILNAQCLQGYSILYLLLQNAKPADISVFLYYIVRLLKHRKDLLLELFTVKTFDDKWTPLHWLAYDGNVKILERFLEVAAKLLKQGSDEFDAFINAQDLDGSTPLAITSNVAHKNPIIKYGGTILHSIRPEIIEARVMGLKLIDAMREDKFSKVQRIIYDAQIKYANNKKLFVEVLTTRTHDGWDCLMHATTISYEYTAFLLHVIENFFKDDEEAFFKILRSVAEGGRSAFQFTIIRRDFKSAKLFMEKIVNYSPNKYFLFILMNIATYAKGFTPLLSAVDFSSDKDEFLDMIEDLINVIIDTFGQDSRAVDLFVNTRDNDGYTALSYALTDKIYDLLVSFGARE